MLFIYILQRKFESTGINSIAVSSHPGFSNTNLFHNFEDKMSYKIIKPLMSPLMQNQDMGALPQIRASVDKNIKGGEYYGPDGFYEMKGFPVLVHSSAASHNLEDTKKLREVSEKFTGVKFEI